MGWLNQVDSHIDESHSRNPETYWTRTAFSNRSDFIAATESWLLSQNEDFYKQMNEWMNGEFGRRLKPLCPIHQERTEITDINIT